MLEGVEQPTKYMVDSIRSKDVEIDSLRATQRRLEAKVKALERACRYWASMRLCVWVFLAAPRFLKHLVARYRNEHSINTCENTLSTFRQINFDEIQI